MGSHHPSLDSFLRSGANTLAAGTVALILVEDTVELDSTLRHHLHCGFDTVLALMPDAFDMSDDVAARVHRIACDTTAPGAMVEAVNQLIDDAAGAWVYYCYNAEYLFYPFCETRRIGEMLAFHTEERRDAMLTYVVDLYAGDLAAYPGAVSLEDACLDRSGYYALARMDPATDKPRDRQLDFYGGLRWRFEEHVPATSRRVDRISLFRAQKGLRLRTDYTFDEQELNTYACPWHRNLTAAVCSFRTAKALKRNPGSTFDIDTFRWHNTTPFEWHSRQLLDLGLMEPGQWF